MTPSDSLETLAADHCRQASPRLPDDAIGAALGILPGWALRDAALVKTFEFANYCETIAFVNAIAWIAHREDHHPDLRVSYDRCSVAWSTHDAKGVTRNDLVCAARIEQLSRR